MTTDQIDVEDVVNEKQRHDEIRKLIVDLGLVLSRHSPVVMLIAMRAVMSSVVRLHCPAEEDVNNAYDIMKSQTLADMRDGIPNMFQILTAANDEVS